LDQAAEEELQQELMARLTQAQEALGILRDYISTGLPFGADEWLQLYGQAAHWAHFNRMGYYTDARTAERELLNDSINYLAAEAQIQILVRHSLRHESIVHKRPDEFVTFSDSLRTRLQATVVSEAIQVFEQKDGVEQFWGEKGNSPLKTAAFDPDSAFHASDEARQKIRELAKRAVEGEKVIQENFRTYFRMLTYAAFERGGSFPVQDARTILSDAAFVESVWRAAVVTPLNPRTMGSLRDDRNNVIKSGVPEASLPLPEWWVETEQEFNSGTEATDSEANDFGP
jgi:hypothetical protein